MVLCLSFSLFCKQKRNPRLYYAKEKNKLGEQLRLDEPIEIFTVFQVFFYVRTEPQKFKLLPNPYSLMKRVNRQYCIVLFIIINIITTMAAHYPMFIS